MSDTRNDPVIPAPAPSVRGVEPLLVGLIGPPASGKTRSMLRMMHGVQRVRPGPIVLIDTEAGRSRKFSPRPGEKADPASGTYDFLRIDLEPPFRSDRCAEAIQKALRANPAAVGFDNASDEHQGEGGYLEWHDDEIPKFGGNEWSAWSRPSAARKRMLSVITHTTVPMFFSFIAQEKTEQVDDPKRAGKKKVKQLGWMPIAPLLFVKALDLTCILPWESRGTPIWHSRDLPGEDFVRKWPDHLLNVMAEGQLTEEAGEALARWAMGETVPAAPRAARSPGAELIAEVKRRAPDAAEQKVLFAELLPRGKASSAAEVAGALVALRAHPVYGDRAAGETDNEALADLFDQEPEGEPLSAETATEIRELAKASGVSMDALEETWGGPLERRPAAREAEICAEIKRRQA